MTERRRVICSSCGQDVPYNHVRSTDAGACRTCVSLRREGREDLIAAVIDGRMTRDYAGRLRTRKMRMARAAAKQTPEDRERRYRQAWRINDEHYERLVRSHGGVCAICGDRNVRRRDTLEPVEIRLALDHDHGTGRFRGLLCDPCNQGIGRFRDDPALLRRAAVYLEQHRDAKCRNGHEVYRVWSNCATCGVALDMQDALGLP